MEQNNTLCCGIDIADRYSQIVLLEQDGQVSEMCRIQTTPRAVKRYFRDKPLMRVAMEASTHSPWMSQLLAEMGYEVLVGNPSKLRLIYENNRKHDLIDAELLARLARFDPQLLYPIIHKDDQSRLAWTVISSRDALVRARTELINHIRGMVKPFGQRLPSCSAERFAKLAPEVPAVLKEVLAPAFTGVATLSLQIRFCDEQIARLCQQQYRQSKLLQQVPGVGPITALMFVLTIGDPYRFSRNRSVGAYLGLVPRRSQTGQSDPELPITKAGNRYLRCLLVQCAHYIMGPFGPDSELRRFGERIAGRDGKSARKRARVAVARRLAVLLLSLWKTGQQYEPFHASPSTDSSAA